MENYLMNYCEKTGVIRGFYLKSIHGDKIPSPNIEISPEKHMFYMDHNGEYKLNPITLEDELLPIPEPLPYQKTEFEILKENQELIKKALDVLILGV
jgi:hypothetical protein